MDGYEDWGPQASVSSPPDLALDKWPAGHPAPGLPLDHTCISLQVNLSPAQLKPSALLPVGFGVKSYQAKQQVPSYTECLLYPRRWAKPVMCISPRCRQRLTTAPMKSSPSFKELAICSRVYDLHLGWRVGWWVGELVHASEVD